MVGSWGGGVVCAACCGDVRCANLLWVRWAGLGCTAPCQVGTMLATGDGLCRREDVSQSVTRRASDACAISRHRSTAPGGRGREREGGWIV